VKHYKDKLIKTSVGYCGGTKEDPTYRQVCSGATGHAEGVRIEFDPAVVSYDELVGASGWLIVWRSAINALLPQNFSTAHMIRRRQTYKAMIEALVSMMRELDDEISA
jgi:hypothetical protein